MNITCAINVILTKYKPAPETIMDFSKFIFLTTRNTVALTRTNVSLSLFSSSFFSKRIFSLLSVEILDCANQVHTNINILFKKISNRIQTTHRQKIVSSKSHESDAKYRRYPLKAPIIYLVFTFWQQDATQQTKRYSKANKTGLKNVCVYIFLLMICEISLKKSFRCAIYCCLTPSIDERFATNTFICTGR